MRAVPLFLEHYSRRRIIKTIEKTYIERNIVLFANARKRDNDLCNTVIKCTYVLILDTETFQSGVIQNYSVFTLHGRVFIHSFQSVFFSPYLSVMKHVSPLSLSAMTVS